MNKRVAPLRALPGLETVTPQSEPFGLAPYGWLGIRVPPGALGLRLLSPEASTPPQHSADETRCEKWGARRKRAGPWARPLTDSVSVSSVILPNQLDPDNDRIMIRYPVRQWFTGRPALAA